MLLRTSYNNRKYIYLKYLFGGHVALFLADARSVFEEEHVKDLDMMDRNNSTHLRKLTNIFLRNETIPGLVLF